MIQRSRFHLAIFLLSLVALAVGALVKGVAYGLDSDGYLAQGQAFLAWLSNMPCAVADINDLFIVPHYIISTSAITVIHTSLGLGSVGVVTFHCVLFACIVWMMFSIWDLIPRAQDFPVGARIQIRVAAGGLYIMFGFPDGVLWTYFVLTEALFLFWVAAFVYAVVRGLWEDNRWMWLTGLVLAIGAPFVRPTGLIIPLLYFLAVVIHYSSWIQRRFWAIAAGAILVPAAFVFVAVPWLVMLKLNDNAVIDRMFPDVLQVSLNQAAVFFQNGTAVEGRVEYDWSGTVSFLEIVEMMLVRIVYFWVPLRFGEPAYGMLHNAVNLAYVALTWPLLAVGIKCLLTGEMRMKLIALFLVMVAYGYALLHAVTLVAFDWRYQLPGMVPYWTLAGCGLVFALRGIGNRRTARSAV